MSNPRLLLAPIVAVLMALAVACGGDSDDDGSTTGATGSIAVPASTPTQATGSSGSTGAAAPTGSTGSTGATGTLDTGSLAASLADVQSFRFDMTVKMDVDVPDGAQGEAATAAALMALFGNIQAKGVYVAPDKFDVETTFLGAQMHVVQIGEQTWKDDGSGWVEDPTAMVTPFGSPPTDLPFEFLPDSELAGAKVTRERLDGVETTRYSFDKESLIALAEATGETAGLEDFGEVESMTLDLWVTEDDVPMRMVMDVKGESEGAQIAVNIVYNITDVNDPGLTVERPL